MKTLILILALTMSGWSQTEDEELQRMIKIPLPLPYYVAPKSPKPPEPSEIDLLKAENARLKAEAQKASQDKWMGIYAEMMELDRPRREAEQMEFNQQMMLWEMQQQTQILREQQQLEAARQRWIQNQSIWYPNLYRRSPNCYTGAFGIVNCW